jgi:hypothetical protein
VKSDFIFWFWRVTLPCTIIASIIELWMAWRLTMRGLRRHWWDTTLYWRVAPQYGWSRLPWLLSMGIVLLGFAALLFLPSK